MLSAVDRIPEIIDAFARNPLQSRQQLTALLSVNPQESIIQGLGVLSMAEKTRGAEFFVAWLMLRNRLFPQLYDANLLSLDEAAAALRVAVRVEPGCDVAQLQELSDLRHGTEPLARMLQLAAKVRLSARLEPILVLLREHASPFLRLKAELLTKRIEQASTLVERRLSDPDPRTQADAVESLWGENTEQARLTFRSAIGAFHHRVAGNGLYGLYLAGDPGSIRLALEMAEDPSPMLRPTAIWFMSETGDSRFLPWLVDAMATSDERQRSQIFHAIRRIRERRAQIAASGTLCPHLLFAAQIGPGERVLRFSVTAENGVALRRMNSTQIVISEAQRMVTNFSLHTEPGAGRLDIIVATPGSPLGLEPPACLREQDQIRFATYETPIQFEDLAAFGPDGGDLILIGDETTLPAVSDIAVQTEWLINKGVRVHTILPENVPSSRILPLESIARKSKGQHLRHGGSFAGLIDHVVSARIQTFEVRYTIRGWENTPAPQVSLQLFTPYGYGACSTVLVARE